jgi:hypothetical protein
MNSYHRAERASPELQASQLGVDSDVIIHLQHLLFNSRKNAPAMSKSREHSQLRGCLGATSVRAVTESNG